jgi:hypothetical protein
MPKKRTADKEIVVPASAAVPVRRKAPSRPRAKRSVEPAETLAAPIAGPKSEVIPTSVETVDSAPTYQEIAALAYSFWEARGCQGGSPHEDWYRAEQQLRKRPSTVVA